MAVSKYERCLFGGAIFGAGIVTAASMTGTAAADMIPLPSFASDTRVFGWDETATPVFDISNSGFFAPTSSYSGGGLDVSAYSSSTLAGVSTFVSDPLSWTFSYASVFHYFSVTNSKEMLVEWDLIGWDSYINSSARVYEIGVGDIFLVDTTTAPGSAMLTLNPGTQYIFVAVMIGYQGDGNDGYGFARISNIPAPGALALLGMGLVFQRRRREEPDQAQASQ